MDPRERDHVERDDLARHHPRSADDVEAALARHDRERAITHHLDRLAPSRRARWPKDDQRSSSHIQTPEEEERHPPPAS